MIIQTIQRGTRNVKNANRAHNGQRITILHCCYAFIFHQLTKTNLLSYWMPSMWKWNIMIYCLFGNVVDAFNTDAVAGSYCHCIWLYVCSMFCCCCFFFRSFFSALISHSHFVLIFCSSSMLQHAVYFVNIENRMFQMIIPFFFHSLVESVENFRPACLTARLTLFSFWLFYFIWLSNDANSIQHREKYVQHWTLNIMFCGGINNFYSLMLLPQWFIRLSTQYKHCRHVLYSWIQRVKK